MILSGSGQWVTLLRFDWEWGSQRFSSPDIQNVLQSGNVLIAHLIKIGSFRIKPPYQPVGMLIQPPLPGVIRPSKVDFGTCHLRDGHMLRELWPVIRRQGFKLTESIRLDVPERFHDALSALIG